MHPDTVTLNLVIKFGLTANEARALRTVLNLSWATAGQFDFWAFLDEMPTDKDWPAKKRGGAFASLTRKGIIAPVQVDEAQPTEGLCTWCCAVDMEGNIVL